MIRNRATSALLALAASALVAAVPSSRASGTATDITGLYYTGLAANGSLQAGGSTDANWDVTYASTNGGSSNDTNYQGAAYVISAASVTGSGYTQNTNNAQWITAPGAETSSGTSPNTGGDFLPGNGNSGSNEGIYIYTLAFTVTGTGSGTVSNDVLITMTLAADDQYSVYVNPSGNGTSIPTSTAAASQTSAWSNKTQITLANYGTDSNAKFKIGTNYIVVVVDNTNSVSGSSTSTSLNASGLLVYQTSAAEINGQPIPEVSTWLPLLGALGFYGLIVLRRRQDALRQLAALA